MYWPPAPMSYKLWIQVDALSYRIPPEDPDERPSCPTIKLQFRLFHQVLNLSCNNRQLGYKSSIAKNSKPRLSNFIFIDLLLANPHIIYFNPRIVDRGNFKIEHSQIDADFLLIKKLTVKTYSFSLNQEEMILSV